MPARFEFARETQPGEDKPYFWGDVSVAEKTPCKSRGLHLTRSTTPPRAGSVFHGARSPEVTERRWAGGGKRGVPPSRPLIGAMLPKNSKPLGRRGHDRRHPDRLSGLRVSAHRDKPRPYSRRRLSWPNRLFRKSIWSPRIRPLLVSARYSAKFRHVRQGKQLHAALVGEAVALVMVAATARSDAVVPAVKPAPRPRDDVVAGEGRVRELAAAVEADVAVAPEERRVGQGWNAPARLHDAPVARDDAVYVEVRLRAVHPRVPAANPQHGVTERPHDQVTRVEARRFLPARPVHGLAGHVQPQDAGRSVELGKRGQHVRIPFWVRRRHAKLRRILTNRPGLRNRATCGGAATSARRETWPGDDERSERPVRQESRAIR